MKINPLVPNILISALPKFIYSYAAALPQWNSYIKKKLNSVTLTRKILAP